MERSNRAANSPLSNLLQRIARTALALTALVGLAILAMPVASAAAAQANGTARVDGLNGFPFTHGGSATSFVTVLPSGAKCAGDSAHKYFHVDSFLVPAGVSPTAVNFRGGVPTKWYGLIADGAYVGGLNTARDTGLIVQLPGPDVWSRLTPAELFSGHATTSAWTAGIACANAKGVVANYWSFGVRFVRSASDKGGFTWSVTEAAAHSSSSFANPFVIVAIALAAGGLWLIAFGRKARTR
ncbi:MAG TPA: hypothetical protein VGO03_12425 [Acidimicrobiia bacterium]|jgi:hypothetical protein